MSSNILVNRICMFCGKEFVAKKTVTKCCSDGCAKRAYKARKRAEKIELSNRETQKIKDEPKETIKDKEFLTVSDVAQLLNSSRQTIYNLIAKGTLKAVNLSKRKTLLKRSEIDKIFN